MKMTLKNQRIHIAGVSAGGYLAAITALEGHRLYPGRIKSTLCWDPMISPASDSMSYYLNSRSSTFGLFVQWSWRAFLSLEDNDKEKTKERIKFVSKTKFCETYEKFLENESNRRLVEQSSFFKDPAVWRLCSPIDNIPSDYTTNNSPNFIISTARYDPLFDEGEQFASQLIQHGAKVTHLQSKSVHASGLDFDPIFKKKIAEVWGKTLFS